MKTVIITDSCSDLPINYVEKNTIPVVSLTYQFRGEDHIDDFGKSISYGEFYNALRGGEMSATSQINVFSYTEAFKKYIKDGYSVIYIAFSSALSGSYNNAVLAKDMLIEEYKDADISVIDSKSASTGEGFLVYYAYEMLNRGCTKDEIVKWVEDSKLKVNHWFTVEDLNHLKRGGRVSGAAAFVGTILDIKPVLHVDDEGRLIPMYKVKGRKKSLRMLADKLKESIVNPEEQTVFISHGDCIDDAEHLKKIILEEVNIKEVIISNVGPVIGSHSGPGTVALFFIGDKR